jgi:hypothetical protein
VGGTGNVTSLGTLLRWRKDQESETRGALVPRTLLADSGMVAGGYPSNGFSNSFSYAQPSSMAMVPTRRQDVPGTLYNLTQVTFLSWILSFFLFFF